MSGPNRHITIAGLIGLGGCAIGLWLDPRTLLASYLVAWIALGAIPIGGLAVLLTTYLVRGGLTFDLFLLLSRCVLTISLCDLLLISFLFVMACLYHWSSETHH